MDIRRENFNPYPKENRESAGPSCDLPHSNFAAFLDTRGSAPRMPGNPRLAAKLPPDRSNSQCTDHRVLRLYSAKSPERS
jgi:hypothetical protein